MRFLLPFLTEVHFPLISDRNKNPQRNDVPERLEISHARNEKDHSLDAPYVENFSHTEYQSEATVYAYLKQVSDFLKRYQELDAEYALLPPEPYDPQNYLLQWRLHMRELINELFNMFVGGNLFSTAAMTRTLMEAGSTSPMFVNTCRKRSSIRRINGPARLSTGRISAPKCIPSHFTTPPIICSL